MAENTETRIVKIEIDQTQALKDLEATENALIDLKKEQKELNDSLKAGIITQDDYVKSKVQLDQKITKETENRKTLTKAITTESGSLDAQKSKLKELITQRDKIDRSTVEGAKKFDEMNKSIKGLNGSIQKAEQQGGSFQRNVENYKGVIDNFTGGAYSAAQGIASMTQASLAFLATPLGLIIAGIALSVAALTAYFRGSEEGQNRWNKIVVVGQTILEKFNDVLEAVGEALFDAFANPKQAMIDVYEFLKDNLINRFTAFKVILDGILSLDIQKIGDGLIQAGTGIEDATSKVKNLAEGAQELFETAITEGSALADMEAEYEKANRENAVAKSKRDLEVSLLRRQADEAEGEQKLIYLNQALALEAESVVAAVKSATLARDIAAEKVRLNGDDKEAKDALAKAEADLFDAQRGAFDETRKMNKERIATEESILAQKQKAVDDEIKFNNELDKARDAIWVEDQKRKKKDIDDAKEKVAKDKEHAAASMQDTADVLAAKLEAAKKAQNDANEKRQQDREAEIQFREDVIAATMATGDVIADINAKIMATRAHQMAVDLQNVKAQQQAELKALQEKLDAGEISEEEFAKEKARIEREGVKAEDEIKRKAFEANKKNRIADSVIDTIQSGIAAFRSLAGVPFIGPILGAAAAAAALVFGYRNVDLIRSEQYVPGGFSIGGYTGPGGVQDPAGVVHRGEVVWNQRDVAAVGGPMVANAMRPTYHGYAEGGIVASSMTNQIDNQFRQMGQTARPYLSIKELHQAEDNLAVKVEIVEA